MAMLLINTLHPDHEFVCDIVDDVVFPKRIRKFFESYPNGFHIGCDPESEEAWITLVEETEFDICDYTDGKKISPKMFGNAARIDKIINIDY